LLPIFKEPGIREAEIFPISNPIFHLSSSTIFICVFYGTLLKPKKKVPDEKRLGNTVLKEDVHFSGAVYPWSSQAGYSSIHHHSTNKNCTRGLQHVM
jgi:hypothetical protein